MKSARNALVLLLAFVFMAGCATLGWNAKPYSQMDPKEKAVFFMEIYNKQFDDAMSMARIPTLSEGQLEVYRQKRAILIKMKPAIQVYGMVASAGGTPTPDQEQAILNFINELTALGG